MPIITSAKKALRQNKKRYQSNLKKKLLVRDLGKKFQKSKTKKDLSLLYSAADKAVKSGVIHKNKARRIKSKFSALTTDKAF